MRPKLVILVLIVAIGVVALAAVLKGVLGGRVPQEVNAPDSAPPEPASQTATTPQTTPVSSNSAAIVEQLRSTEIAKELDQIRELQAEGTESPQATGLLLGKVTHREPEVRKAARDALIQLGDTNAIPGLEQAVGLVEDPREKMAMMDAIDYLKLPDAMAIQPTMADNGGNPVPVARPRKTVPKAPKNLPGRNRRPAGAPIAPGGAAAQPATTANPYPAQPETQPSTPAPDTAPPADSSPPQ